jgi:hypothetical protein
VGVIQLRVSLFVLLLLGLVSGGLAEASRAAAPTLPKVEYESGVYCCLREEVAVKPFDIVFSNDGHALFAGARWVSSKKFFHPLIWKTWTSTSATGTGDLWVVSPRWVSPASGVRLTLWRPKRIRGYLIFTRITVTYTSSKPPKAAPRFVMVLDRPCYCDWSGFSGNDFW